MGKIARKGLSASFWILVGWVLWWVAMRIPLNLMDESHYLYLSQQNLTFWADNSLYLFWLKFLGLLCTDPLFVYTLNFWLLNFLALLLLNSLLARAAATQWVSVYFFIWFMSSTLWLYAYPYQTRFLAIFLMLAFGLYATNRHWPALFLLCLSPLVRQECYLLIVLLTLFFVWQKKPSMALFALLMGCLYCLFPLQEADGGQRLEITFLQHLAYNLQQKRLFKANVWLEYEAAKVHLFRDYKAPFSINNLNLQLVFKHFCWNLRQLFHTLRGLLPAMWPFYHKIAFFATFLLEILYAKAVFKRVHRDKNANVYVMGFLCMLPAMSISILIFPRTHYIWSWLFGGFFLGFWFIKGLQNRMGLMFLGRLRQTTTLLILRCVILSFFLYQSIWPLLCQYEMPLDDNRRMVHQLRREVRDRTVILSSIGSFDAYLPLVKTILASEKRSNWWSFVKEHQIEAVLVGEELLLLIAFKDDSAFQAWYKNSQERLRIGAHHELIWVKAQY